MADKKSADRQDPEELLHDLAKEGPGWMVINWSPHRDRGPDTEVHLITHKGPLAVVLKLKSRADVDELIAALAKNRDRVWPTQ